MDQDRAYQGTRFNNGCVHVLCVCVFLLARRCQQQSVLLGVLTLLFPFVDFALLLLFCFCFAVACCCLVLAFCFLVCLAFGLVVRGVQHVAE